MRLKFNKIKKWAVAIGSIFAMAMTPAVNSVYAEGQGISMSPPSQIIVLNAGETYSGSFNISNPQTNSENFNYEVTVKPFFVDENYNIYYRENEGINQIVNWVKLDTTSGTLHTGDSQRIGFEIDVPKDAPAGGQYVAINVASTNSSKTQDASGESVGISMNQNIAMAHIIYAEIAGTTRHSGEVMSTNVPSFLLDGNISAESTIKNTGNTHGTATYKLQIFPLFSSEEVYTNEEDPKKVPILPNRTFTNRITWDQTPAMGIFNVKYTVEFEGVTTEVTKLVIKCPLWLLFIILFAIIAIIIWIIIRIRVHKKSSKGANLEPDI